ncbi:MAG: DUF3160 domain-containing protein [Actinomycetota bacterium]|nr:DUF3160 domain-containing protein [Actinomycetota bacterium]
MGRRARGRKVSVVRTAFIVLALAAAIAVAGCAQGKLKGQTGEAPDATKSGASGRSISTAASSFAEYIEVTVTVDPKVPAYTVEKDLGNVVNAKDFELSPAAKKMLVKNGFVVAPSWSREYYPIYETNRYEFTPNFITTDSMLHNYHLFFSHLLKTVEKDKLSGELKELNKGMLAAAVEQYKTLEGTEWESAAKRNVGFFAVASKLLDPGVEVPAVVEKEVAQELKLIAARKAMTASPVMNIGVPPDIAASQLANKEDYTQYIVRGHYEKSKLLQAYFKSMMWYGRLTFRVGNEDEMRSALLMTLALDNPGRERSWNAIYEPTNFFVGKSDDIAYYEFKDLVGKVYGKNAGLTAVVGGDNAEARFAGFIKEAKKLDPPKINSIPIFREISPQEREELVQGFRFMGQRYTVDADIFQRLVDGEVVGRMLPKGLDIPAAMGSDEALGILDSMGETKFENYTKNMGKMRKHIGGLDTRIWTQNLYWSWMYSLLSLVEEKSDGYPSFMRNAAWVRKELSTYLGSWTELKHDTILYAKQVYAEAGGDVPAKKDDRGYVEPNPYLYARLASLLAMTREGLEARGLLDARDKTSLERMETLALSFKTISEKELENKPLTDAEYELIRGYGAQLEHFWIEALRDADVKSGATLDNSPAAVVADVATNPGSGRVLEEATGNVFQIYVVAPVAGKLKICAGGVYSYYEFPWPATDRLTDSKWRSMLDDNKAPALPGWTDAFMVAPEGDGFAIKRTLTRD